MVFVRSWYQVRPTRAREVNQAASWIQKKAAAARCEVQRVVPHLLAVTEEAMLRGQGVKLVSGSR